MRLPRLEMPRRPGSLRELHELREAGDLDTLRSYIEDPDVSLRKRRRAVQCFCTCAPGGGGRAWKLTPVDPAVVPTCIKLLETETDPGIRNFAVFGLRQSGSPDAEDALIGALDTEDRATRENAMIGLAELGSDGAVEAIAARLGDPETKKAAVWALARIGNEASAVALRRAAAENPEYAEDLLAAAAKVEAGLGSES